VSLATTEGTPFAAGAEVHPSIMEAKDGLGVTVPLCVLASQDEDPNLIKEFEANLKVPKYVEIYDKVPHGWLSAR
jgi:hypothetical protein